jgi:glycerol kinase
MESDSGIRLKELRVDGGAARNDALMQFQADVLGVRVVRPRVHETTALGAAYLAGLGVGFWNSADQLDAQWQIGQVFEPRMDKARVDEFRAGWRNAVARARDWARPD